MDNMKGFGMMIHALKESPKTIVFTEGTDERILEAASRLLAGNFLTPILVGNKEAVLEAAESMDTTSVAERSLIRMIMRDLTRW